MGQERQVLIIGGPEVETQPVAGLLKTMGCLVQGEAQSPAEAVSLAQGSPPDLVIVRIPPGDGAPFRSAADELFRLYSMPMVFLTHPGAKSYDFPAHWLGKAAFLEEPWRDIELKTVVNLALGRTLGEKSNRSDRGENHVAGFDHDIYRQIVQNSLAGIYFFDSETFRFVNPRFASMLGYDHPEEIVGRSIWDLVHPSDLELIRGLDQKRRRGESGAEHYTFRGLKKDGSAVCLETLSTTTEICGRRATLGSVLDITARKKAEEALMINETNLRSLMESASGFALFRLDIHPEDENGLRPAFVSPSIVEMLDLTDPYDFEAWFDRIHPEDSVRLQKAFRGLTSVPKLDETVRLSTGPTDEWRWVQFISTGAADNSGRPAHVNGILFDVSKIKKVEMELIEHRESMRRMGAEIGLLEERERRSVAAELHDNLGQSMALAQLKIKSLIGREASGALKTELLDLSALVGEMIQKTKSLTFQLSPPVLHELGLIDALEWLTEEIQAEHGLRVKFSVLGKNVRFSHDLSVILFRAVRELLLNVVKHARAEMVTVVMDRKPGRVRIEVQDDGRGLKTDGAGLKGPQKGYGLFSLRERIIALGGRVDIESAPGKGTRVVLQVPL